MNTYQDHDKLAARHTIPEGMVYGYETLHALSNDAVMTRLYAVRKDGSIFSRDTLDRRHFNSRAKWQRATDVPPSAQYVGTYKDQTEEA